MSKQADTVVQVERELGGTTRRAPQQKRSRETVARIMDAAEALFADIGFMDTSVIMIAQQAGVSPASAYAYFRNKEEIFLSIMERFMHEAFAYTEASIEYILSDDQDLAKTIEWLVPGLYEAHKLNGKLNHEMNMFAFMDPRAEAIYAEWEQVVQREALRLLTHFRRQLKLQDLKAASIIIYSIIMWVFQYLFMNRDRVDEEAVIAELVRMLKDHIVGS